MKICIRILALLMLFTPAIVSAAAGDVAKLKSDIQATEDKLAVLKKKAIIVSNLGLSAKERGVFWPVYEKFQKELDGNDARLLKLLQKFAKNFNSLSDKQAKDLLTEFLAIQEDRIKLKRSYIPRFEKVIPIKKVARYIQIENKLDVIGQNSLVGEIPLVK
ncbi:MAG: hypothetical protein BMS9Abin15_0220 [Gammaproteobacteria bacterium]|nr:MAG: hypothetical protein BMS9Abin15_0220 [Gammaproteobacteria bacterium]